MVNRCLIVLFGYKPHLGITVLQHNHHAAIVFPREEVVFGIVVQPFQKPLKQIRIGPRDPQFLFRKRLYVCSEQLGNLPYDINAYFLLGVLLDCSRQIPCADADYILKLSNAHSVFFGKKHYIAGKGTAVELTERVDKFADIIRLLLQQAVIAA